MRQHPPLHQLPNIPREEVPDPGSVHGVLGSGLPRDGHGRGAGIAQLYERAVPGGATWGAECNSPVLLEEARRGEGRNDLVDWVWRS